MKIAQTASKLLPNEFTKTTLQIKNAITTGWKNGSTLSKINNKGLINDMYTRTKCVTKEIKTLKVNNENLPIFAAAFAYIAPIPIPGLTIYTYAITKGIVKISNFINKYKQTNISTPKNKNNVITKL